MLYEKETCRTHISASSAVSTVDIGGDILQGIPSVGSTTHELQVLHSFEHSHPVTIHIQGELQTGVAGELHQTQLNLKQK